MNCLANSGGLPNPHLFPVKAIEQACQDVLREQGAAALQYATTEGFAPLRQYIADCRQRPDAAQTLKGLP